MDPPASFALLWAMGIRGRSYAIRARGNLPLVSGHAISHFRCMRKQSPTSPFALPMMMTHLTFASWETIFHRTMMMAQGTCSAAEYQRMGMEKAAAVARRKRRWW